MRREELGREAVVGSCRKEGERVMRLWLRQEMSTKRVRGSEEYLGRYFTVQDREIGREGFGE